MRSRVAAAVIGAAMLVALPSLATAAPSRADSARLGAGWLAKRQNGDGSFASAGRADLTAETLAAAVVGRASAKTVNRALDYIGSHGREDATRGAFTGRIVAGIVAAGGNPWDHDGTDYVALLDAGYDAASGAYDTKDPVQLFPNLLAANGVIAAHGDVPARTLAFVRDNECPGGGFGFDLDCPRGPDVDTTAWAINVLVASGEKSDAAVTRARGFLRSSQRSDGGFAFTRDLPTSADSTGLALSALAALDEDATKPPWRQSDGDSPAISLMSLQEDSGGFRPRASGKAATMPTTNAIPGIAAVDYPILPGEHAPADAEQPEAPARTAAPSAPSSGGPSAADEPSASGEQSGTTSRTPDPTPTPTPTPHPTGRAAVDVVRGEDEPAPFAGRATEGDTPSTPARSILWSPALWVGVVSAAAGGGLIFKWWRARGVL